MQDGLYGILDDLKSNAVPFVVGGAGVVAGLTIGKLSHDFVAELVAPLTKAGPPDAEGKPTTVPHEDAAVNQKSFLRLYVAPLVPVALGIAAVVYGRGQVPAVAENFVEGAGLGLAAWGVGRLFTNVATPQDGTAPPTWLKYLPNFQGTGDLANYYLRRARIQGLGQRHTQLPDRTRIAAQSPVPNLQGRRSSAFPTSRRVMAGAAM